MEKEEVLPENRITAAVSPYFGRYNDRSETTSTRIMLNGQISYEPIKNLVITGKVSYDKGYSMYDAAVVPRFRQSDFVPVLSLPGVRVIDGADSVVAYADAQKLSIADLAQGTVRTIALTDFFDDEKVAQMTPEALL